MTLHHDIARKLAEAGIPLTSQRLLIACELFAEHCHLSADELLLRVGSLTPDISRATVYNTLKLFSQKGLVQELVVDNGKRVYDSNTAPHPHCYNADTGELTDVHQPLQLAGPLPELPPGTALERVDIIVRVRNVA
ncbi:Fur family transcriptional regulator [Vogesella sp. DC21W]|uniref:Ferric uptake regulation protein n=1 Tax=Vogesella aquatica TaxID=2984206 RepID=A0ABT5ITK8_9NEIS|nr:Fur family transcriptional regulator [Vogesella aquatica]MDC7715843.1 Fur family transcriptional regulator [Vogesella aquatica]